MSARESNLWRDRYDSVVAFDLASHVMAVPTDILREILEPTDITRVPAADTLSSGLMNVRGVVIPVADLRPVLKVEVGETTLETRILVLEFPVGDTPLAVGLIVDKVHAVIGIDAATVRPSPDVGTAWNSRAMACVARWEDAPIYLPDIETIFRNRIDRNQARTGQPELEAAHGVD